MLELLYVCILLLVAFWAWARHDHALILTTALLPAYTLYFSLFGIPSNIPEAAVLVTFAVSVTKKEMRREWIHAAHIFPKALYILIACFLIAATLSTIVSPHLHTSLGILKGWIIAPIIYAWMVYARAVHNVRIRHSIVNALVASGAVVSIIGLFQGGVMDRVRSVYDVPNSLALFISPIIVMAVWRYTEGSLPRRAKKMYAAAIASMVLALIATQSIAGIVSVVVALSAGMFLFRMRARKMVWIFLVIAAVGIGGMVYARDRIPYLLSQNSSASVRMQLWSVSLSLISEHPLLGVGLGTFEPAYQAALHEKFKEYAGCVQQSRDCKEPRAEFVFRDPHNWVFSFWLNMGLIGLISFIGVSGLSVWRGRRYEGIVIAFIAMLIFGLADTIYWKNDLSMMYWLFIFLLAPDRTDEN